MVFRLLFLLLVVSPFTVGCDARLGSSSPSDVEEVDAGPPDPCGNYCSGYFPHCDFESASCVQCTKDWHCGPQGDLCIHGECAEVVCTPNSSICQPGNVLHVCNEQGTEFTAFHCEGPCVLDHCEACIPDTKTCDGKVILDCNENGDWEEGLDCGEEQICLNGNCLFCVPNKEFCHQGDVHGCDPFGGTSTFKEDCRTEETGLVCHDGHCSDNCAVNLKFNTSIGCEYWAVDLDNAIEEGENGEVLDAQNAPFAVIVANPLEDHVATVKVLQGETVLEEVKVPPLQLRTFLLPPLNVEGTVQGALAYGVVSNSPITAFQFNPLDNVAVFSNDASMLLPANALGGDYLVMTRAQSQANRPGFVTVVAAEDGDTTVVVTPSVTTAESADGSIPELPAGKVSPAFHLERGEVLSLETKGIGDDLTGTIVQADKRVAVFAGVEAVNVPTTEGCTEGVCDATGWVCESPADCPVTCCADHIEQQIPPVTTWGTRHLATHTFSRGAAKDVWRILSVYPNTHVSTVPHQHPIGSLGAGEWVEFSSGEDFLIEADKPILVGQFLASQNAPDPNNDTCEWFEQSLLGSGNFCAWYFEHGQYIKCETHAGCPNVVQEDSDALIGDPAYILSVPYEQFRSDYVLMIPDQYDENFVNISAPSHVTVFLNGKAMPENLFESLGNGFFKVARMPLDPGVHRVSSSEPVGAIVYGWSLYVSYGYPAGQNLEILTL